MKVYSKPEIAIRSLTVSEKLMNDCTDGKWYNDGPRAPIEGEFTVFGVCEVWNDGSGSAA